MKFTVDLPEDIKEYLENQFSEYLKKREMTEEEKRAVREWVEAGNSVYDNPMEAWQEGQTRVEFLDIYRDEEYIRQHVKDMSFEEALAFVKNFYGMIDEPDPEGGSLTEVDPDEVPFE